jgi:hypothetical protein
MNTGTWLRSLLCACAVGALATEGMFARSGGAPAPGAPSPAPAAPSPPSTTLPGGELAELLSAYVPRSVGDLQRLLADARVQERIADSEIDGAQRLAVEAEGRVRILRGEMLATRTRRDVAHRSGDLAARTRAEVAFRRQTREADYLEKLRDTMRQDAERATAERGAAAARVKALDLELNLARMNADLRQPNPSLLAISRYRDVLWQVLEAQRAAADRARDASAEQSRVAEMRLRQVYSLSMLGR